MEAARTPDVPSVSGISVPFSLLAVQRAYAFPARHFSSFTIVRHETFLRTREFVESQCGVIVRTAKRLATRAGLSLGEGVRPSTSATAHESSCQTGNCCAR